MSETTGMRRPRGAARTLARGWSQDGRKWTWATTVVLASTLVVLLATAGLLDGTTDRTLDQVSDFYTGQLRITPARAGAPPADWFAPNHTASQQLQGAGATVAERVEAQFILSRRGFADTYANEQVGVPVGVPGSDADPRKVVALGVVIGIESDDPGKAAIEGHLTDGRMPRASADDAPMEVLMSVARMDAFLIPEERNSRESLLSIGSSFHFDLTSAQLDPESDTRIVLHRQAKVVGLFETGVDMLDAYTLVAPAPEVRYLLGRDRDEAVSNALIVLSGSASARDVAARNNWAMEDTSDLAGRFVGQMIGVLQAVAWLVTSELFILPAALIGYGLARQLASQQRELAVATAIGVPGRTLGNALAMQVFAMAGWACLLAAVTTVILAFLLPLVLPAVPAPLPLGFVVSLRSVVVAASVTAVSVAVGLWVGFRSRARLSLAASLRAG